MKARNLVIAGDYAGKAVACGINSKLLVQTSPPFIVLGWLKPLTLDRTTVARCELVDATHYTNVNLSTGRALLGTAFLGPLGSIAGLKLDGAMVYLLEVEFTDGKKSLLEVDSKLLQSIVENIF